MQGSAREANRVRICEWHGADQAGVQDLRVKRTSVLGSEFAPLPPPPTLTVWACPPARGSASRRTILSPALAWLHSTRAAHRPVTPLPTTTKEGM